MTSFVQPDMFRADAVKVWPFGSLKPYSYDFIMIDPPWKFATYSDKGKGKSPDRHYATMSIEDIKALPVADLAADNCLLWVWGTAPMLPQQFDVIAHWGFTYKTKGVWVKRTVNGKLGFSLGYGFRNAHEEIILAKIGEPVLERDVRSVIEGPLRENSRKPDEAYREAERLMPYARRADVFSREDRKGWEACGDECGKFNSMGDSNVRDAS
jgi:N6-adenosine-specific RNA methylase IME4